MLSFAVGIPGYLSFAWAYRESARVLAEHFPRDMESTLPAPLVFLFRHALEVYLKASSLSTEPILAARRKLWSIGGMI